MLLVCIAFTALILSCIIAFVRKHHQSLVENGQDGIKDNNSDEDEDHRCSDLLFTRLFKVLLAILPSFGAAGASDGNSSAINSDSSANNSGNKANNKGYEKSLQMLLNVITSKKIAYAVAKLGTF